MLVREMVVVKEKIMVRKMVVNEIMVRERRK